MCKKLTIELNEHELELIYLGLDLLKPLVRVCKPYYDDFNDCDYKDVMIYQDIDILINKLKYDNVKSLRGESNVK